MVLNTHPCHCIFSSFFAIYVEARVPSFNATSYPSCSTSCSVNVPPGRPFIRSSKVVALQMWSENVEVKETKMQFVITQWKISCFFLSRQELRWWHVYMKGNRSCVRINRKLLREFGGNLLTVRERHTNFNISCSCRLRGRARLQTHTMFNV